MRLNQSQPCSQLFTAFKANKILLKLISNFFLYSQIRKLGREIILCRYNQLISIFLYSQIRKLGQEIILCRYNQLISNFFYSVKFEN